MALLDILNERLIFCVTSILFVLMALCGIFNGYYYISLLFLIFSVIAWFHIAGAYILLFILWVGACGSWFAIGPFAQMDNVIANPTIGFIVAIGLSILFFIHLFLLNKYKKIRRAELFFIVFILLLSILSNLI